MKKGASTNRDKWEKKKLFGSAYSQKFCSAPEDLQGGCSSNIVRAHTVPRASLNTIAVEGHVLGYKMNATEIGASNGKLKPEKIGVRDASTFTGFCQTHDNSIFAPLEKHDFVGSLEQCFLLHYRAIAREFSKKKAQFDFTLAQARSNAFPSAEKILGFDQYLASVSLGLQDISTLKNTLDKSLRNEDFSNIRAHIYSLEKAPPLMCSGAWAPTHDFEGNLLQDLCDPQIQTANMSCTSFSSRGGSFVVFAWIEHDGKVCDQFVRSLNSMNPDQIGPALTRLVFNQFENIFLSPDWWQILSKPTKEALVARIHRATDIEVPLIGNELADDGIEIPGWEIVGRSTADRSNSAPRALKKATP